MKAVNLVPTRNGGVYEYRDAKKPKPEGSQVLVKVKAAGVNRGEILMAKAFNSADPRFGPMPAGIEFAGDIVELGPDATGWHIGERVMARAFGSYAEYALAGSLTLMRIPDQMSYEQAAAVPNVYITAHDALISNAKMRKGESVIATAASSGIGMATIQLAKLFGAKTVIGTTRDVSKKQALVDAGADIVLVTKGADYPDAVKKATDDEGADVIIDSVGGPMFADNIEALAVKGRIVTVGRNAGDMGEINLDEIANKRAQLIGVTFRTRTPQEAWRCFEVFVEDCADAFKDGSLLPLVDRTFQFDQLHDAHNYMMADSQVGKIVLVNEH